MKNVNIVIACMLAVIPTINKAMLTESMLRGAAGGRTVQQCAIIKPFLRDISAIVTVRKTMDDIEARKLGYPDYSKRTGLVWSDVSVKTSDAQIIEEFDTTKVTEVDGALQQQKTQSIMSYPTLKSVVCGQVFPKMFDVIQDLERRKLPEKVFSQIFFQRCNTSDVMDWHQDPGEDYDPQANYSLILMLSQQDDPEHGWDGGVFKIKPGLPKEEHLESEVATIVPYYNQAVLFNNQINSHSVTAVTSKTGKTKRDLMVVTLNTTKMPLKKVE